MKGRVLETDDLPLLVCDSYPEISITNVDDYSNLIKPFDLDKSLARFFIVDNKYGMFIVYGIHHIISDATSKTIINRDLGLALSGELDKDVDLGFVYASRDSFDSQFKPDYDAAYGFFSEMLADIDEVSSLLNDVDGCAGSVTEHGRHEDYSQDALGMFVRTIPILVDCTNASVDDYLSDVSNLILESMGNSVYPFRLLASEFGLSNSITFEYNYDLNDASGVGDEIVFSDEASCVSDLLCVVNDLDDGFLVSLNHVDIISQDTAERFVNVFKEILIQFLDKETLSDIDYTCSSDLALLDTFNDTEHDLIYNDVLDAYNVNLSRYPDNMLVSYEDCYYTYGEGAYIAEKVAQRLVDLGVNPHDNIAFLVERSELYMFCVLGVLSCGGVYVPLDDKLPDERIRFILEDTNCGVVIVSDETYDHAVGLVNDDSLVLLNISDIVNDEIGTLNRLPVVYGDLACILYTSGTTGIPKGVKIRRKGINNFIDYYVNKYDMHNDSTFGLFSSIGFDVGAIR
ncbi:AMP-binding protein, partial [uncultured Methanobrevibacter sp.]|uniref:AMP-binding protein n=1 Tax=uncultured Methanobrevibacter sp. TaxID=253161 RepID=UPI0025D08A82